MRGVRGGLREGRTEKKSIMKSEIGEEDIPLEKYHKESI